MAKTLEKQAVLNAFNQRVMAKADALFNAQLVLAVGSMKVFRVNEVEDGGKKRREHVHVTDADEIKALLDEHDGAPGVVKGVYYYFSDVMPDNRAIEAMLNRALGKAVDKIEIVKPAEAAKGTIQTIMTETGLSEEEARAIVSKTFGVSEQELISESVN